MATLVLTAVGTALGGPLGGAIGALLGQQVDGAIAGSPKREGPRLKELELTTSSYGSPVPRHFGQVRRGGTIIWATDLKEHRESSGGGKGKPKVSTYSYSASFAVALASRPISALARVWSDGNLLRGADGDLKVGGEMRVYLGHGDQRVDPLIAADRGADCPAFRGLAYAVFENLELGEFGNRIPALTFEIIADDGEVTLAQLLDVVDTPLVIDATLPGLEGLSDDGAGVASLLATLAPVYPLRLDASGPKLTVGADRTASETAPLLPPASALQSEEGFAARTGVAWTRQSSPSTSPRVLRYYDPARDYLAGVQRAGGRPPTGRERTIEVPGVFSANTARQLIEDAAARASHASERLSWRTTTLDPALRPGRTVRVPGFTGHWLIERWEWRDGGIELELQRLPGAQAASIATDPGGALIAPDLVGGPTVLRAFELPLDGSAPLDQRRVFAALSSPARGWRGAALFVDTGSTLVAAGAGGASRATLGSLQEALGPSGGLMLAPDASVLVQLLADDLALSSSNWRGLAQGANLALVGDELLQFGEAVPRGAGLWQLRGLMRARGGTGIAAAAGHAPGTPFTLLDDTIVAIDPATIGTHDRIAAIGLGDSEPVYSTVAAQGITLAPLAPVHGKVTTTSSGALHAQWTRRARGGWNWSDGVDVPLVEQTEAYRVGIGPASSPVAVWQVNEPRLLLSPSQHASLRAKYAGQPIWVSQTGTHASSPPLRLSTIAV